MLFRSVGRLSAGGVASFDSHGRAPSLLLPGPAFSRRLPECYLFAEFGTRVGTPPVIRSSAGGSGLFSHPLGAGLARPGSGTFPMAPDWVGSFGSCIQRPKRFTRHITRTLLAGRLRPLFPGPSRPVLSLRRRPKIRAAKPFTRGPKAWRSGHFGTLVGATGGDPNTLAPNRLEARPCPSRPSRTSTSF